MYVCELTPVAPLVLGFRFRVEGYQKYRGGCRARVVHGCSLAHENNDRLARYIRRLRSVGSVSREEQAVSCVGL